MPRRPGRYNGYSCAVVGTSATAHRAGFERMVQADAIGHLLTVGLDC